MDPGSHGQPWQDLEKLIDESDPTRVTEYLDSIPAGDVALTVSRLSDDAQEGMLAQMSADAAASLLARLSETQAADLLRQLEPVQAAALLEHLTSDRRADLMAQLPLRYAAEVIKALPAEMAAALRRLIEYPSDTAGGIMVTELLSYHVGKTAGQVIDDMRARADRYRDYQVQYAFVTDAADVLVGVLRLRDLLLARRDQPLSELMIRQPLTVGERAPLDELRDFFREHDFLGVPVVDGSGRLLGLVQRSAVTAALGQRAEEDYLKTQGIVREELRTMPLWTRSRRRLAWLSANIVLNLIAASVIAVYQDILAQVIALAVFLPIISDMSGCSGYQAVAVSMRELTLGLIRPSELARVWFKEITVGLINGVLLGAAVCVLAILWKGNAMLGLVVGAALLINTLVAVTVGGMLPLVMKLLKMDPALASGPLLTTVTDMCGFFLILSMAAAVLPWLTGPT